MGDDSTETYGLSTGWDEAVAQLRGALRWSRRPSIIALPGLRGEGVGSGTCWVLPAPPRAAEAEWSSCSWLFGSGGDVGAAVQIPAGHRAGFRGMSKRSVN
jgi:hypothetical protein